MKKKLLSVAVIAAFALYAAYDKIAGTNSIFSPNVAQNGVKPASVATQNLSRTSQDQPANSGYNSQTQFSSSRSIGTVLKNGTWRGQSADAYYGNVQVQAVVKAGKLTEVVFLDYPHDRSTSQEINSYAMPILKSEAVSTQNANVDVVSGATQTSLAFQTSLADALRQAAI